MIVAEIKKKENVVEYIIYLKQVQDIIRANNFDINKIDRLIISKYQVDPKTENQIKEWYSDFILSMKSEKLEKSGDIDTIRNLTDELNKIHLALLSDENNYKHQELYRWAKPNIEEYKKISRQGSDNEIEIAINALYGLLLLRLQKKEISVETIEAMQTFSNLLAHIALVYHKLHPEG
ncbi:MAG: DUF4924 family protein [Bacteroidales bacterium]|jgi:hypothetical protein|nr:DUF4924 family protein [Bacteroidales bacterium]